MITIIIAMAPMMLSYFVAYRSIPFPRASPRIWKYKEVLIMMRIATEPMMLSYIVAYRSIPFLSKSATPLIFRGYDYDYTCDGAGYAVIHRGLQVNPNSRASARIHTS